jgi:hypothetical protein
MPTVENFLYLIKMQFTVYRTINLNFFPGPSISAMRSVEASSNSRSIALADEIARLAAYRGGMAGHRDRSESLVTSISIDDGSTPLFFHSAKDWFVYLPVRTGKTRVGPE